MNKLVAPTICINDFYLALISNIIKKCDGIPLKPLYEDIHRILVLEEIKYRQHAINGTLMDLSPYEHPSEFLKIKDMKFLYEKLKKEQREIYNQIKATSYMKRCPYCEKRDISELDHFLSQSLYPMYVITPINLIPSCHECNNAKRDDDIEIIHPYFDDTLQTKWMVCELSIMYNVLVVNYKISFVESPVPERTRRKIVNTVNKMQLHKYYATWTASLISNKKGLWFEQFKEGGIDSLIRLITREYNSIDSKLESINSYKKVFYHSFIEFLKDENADISFLYN